MFSFIPGRISEERRSIYMQIPMANAHLQHTCAPCIIMPPLQSQPLSRMRVLGMIDCEAPMLMQQVLLLRSAPASTCRSASSLLPSASLFTPGVVCYVDKQEPSVGRTQGTFESEPSLARQVHPATSPSEICQHKPEQKVSQADSGCTAKPMSQMEKMDLFAPVSAKQAWLSLCAACRRSLVPFLVSPKILGSR